jgi:glycosyltransferase involved in cell wall biosynthesis
MLGDLVRAPCPGVGKARPKAWIVRVGSLECRMRIAFYAPLKSPDHDIPSGDRRVGRLLMDALRLAGHAVDLASDFRSFDGDGNQIRQALLRDQGGAIADRLVARWLNAALQERPAMWFTYHLYYKAPDWIGPRVSKALGIPYVVAEASYAAKRDGGLWGLGHIAVRDAIQAANLLLCPTHDDLAGLRQIAATRTRLVRLPPFLDPTPYRAAAEKRDAQRAGLSGAYGLQAQQPWLVVVAMMRSGDKLASYRLLAQSLANLADLAWQILVVGDGSARSEIQALLENAAPGRTHFLGERSSDELAGIYAASDICIWPSVNEAYGMAMLEAQAAGIPVVSCAVRGVPDVVCDRRTGLLAAPGDAAGLAVLTRELLVDPARRTAMGQAAAQFVFGERSTWEAARRLNRAFADMPQRMPIATAIVSGTST